MSHNDDLMIPRYVNMTDDEYGYLLSQSRSHVAAEIVALKNEVASLKEKLKTIKVCICGPG